MPQLPATPTSTPYGVSVRFASARIAWSIAPPKKRPLKNIAALDMVATANVGARGRTRFAHEIEELRSSALERRLDDQSVMLTQHCGSHAPEAADSHDAARVPLPARIAHSISQVPRGGNSADREAEHPVVFGLPSHLVVQDAVRQQFLANSLSRLDFLSQLINEQRQPPWGDLRCVVDCLNSVAGWEMRDQSATSGHPRRAALRLSRTPGHPCSSRGASEGAAFSRRWREYPRVLQGERQQRSAAPDAPRRRPKAARGPQC